ncbi:MAG: tRNA preQ1(34) S-adenosylmethionine ribosyltransferase-isomerase QueA [Fimbriimonadaceae bacterium]|nr:MAG: tRNA preQ1(34) S-adenosylmethionine ribosyltransferase-isomerase QueA [Fimbriimonadaceae bacterium]
MNLEDLDYFLPEELIAQEPLADRTASRMLHINRNNGEIHHKQFVDSIDLLEPCDLLILNNTRVSAMRLFGHKISGGAVEALLLKEASAGVFECLLKPAKRLPVGTEIQFESGLVATVSAKDKDGVNEITFHDSEGWRKTLEAISVAPLPPYIHTHLRDRERYQTVIAQHPGSAAAPTAGLHFTQEYLDRIIKKGIQLAEVTLHVGVDTFRPVQTGSLADHQMHGEVCEVPEKTARLVSECQGRIIAVGTTTTRTLETFATGKRQLQPGKTVSKLFIQPGYEFQIVDGMFTNFHMPRTTMLLMISALASPKAIATAYSEAVNLRYRFLSFGDSMLIL